MHLFLAAMKKYLLLISFFLSHLWVFWLLTHLTTYFRTTLWRGFYKKRMNPGTLQHICLSTTSTVAPTEGKEKSPHEQWSRLVGGFNPLEKYLSNWKSSPNRDENKKYLKPPPWRPLWHSMNSWWESRFEDPYNGLNWVVVSSPIEPNQKPRFCLLLKYHFPLPQVYLLIQEWLMFMANDVPKYIYIYHTWIRSVILVGYIS